MDFSNIKYSVLENVALMVLNRPKVLNSINTELAGELQYALSDSGDNPEVRAILLTGNGKGFCAGQDLNEALQPNGTPESDLGIFVRENYNPIIKLLREIPKPIICAVNGTAAGAGANIALACDIVVASENASFIQAFSKIGLIPDSGGTYYLPRLVGLGKAASLMMLGEKLLANEAMELGLIYKVFPLDKLEEESINLAKHLAAQPTKALGLIKKLLNKSIENTLDEQLKLEEEMQRIAGQTDDYKEGIKAFLEKRKPEFKGK